MTTLLLATLVTLGADVEPLAVPKGPPPHLLFLTAKGERVTMTRSVTIPLVTMEKQKRNVDGREVEVDVPVTKLLTKTSEVEIPVDRGTLHTASGKKLTVEEVKKRLSGGAIVALSMDGKPVDKSYLTVLKADMVIIVFPAGLTSELMPVQILDFGPPPQPLPAPGRIRPMPAPDRR